jgi:hypothetical protein
MLIYWIILIIAFFLLWIFLGGRQHEFVGLNPLFNNQPLPEDPLAMNSFYLNQLKMTPQITYAEGQRQKTQDDKELQNAQISRHKSENQNLRGKNITALGISLKNPITECSYDAFIHNQDENNIIPEVEEKIIDPSTDKKRISELLHMSMNPNLKSKWKYQNLCCQVLEEIYKKPFSSISPTWLKNPETGGILEIDCYNDELKIGVEYNGIQHYRYPNMYHKTYDEFIKQVRRDQYKHKKCDDNGVYLITVPYNVPQNKIRDYILHYLPENVSRRSGEINRLEQVESYQSLNTSVIACKNNHREDMRMKYGSEQPNIGDRERDYGPTTTYKQYLA